MLLQIIWAVRTALLLFLPAAPLLGLITSHCSKSELMQIQLALLNNSIYTLYFIYIHFWINLTLSRFLLLFIIRGKDKSISVLSLMAFSDCWYYSIWLSLGVQNRRHSGWQTVENKRIIRKTIKTIDSWGGVSLWRILCLLHQEVALTCLFCCR